MTAHSAVAHVSGLAQRFALNGPSQRQTTAGLVPLHESQAELVRAARCNRPLRARPAGRVASCR